MKYDVLRKILIGDFIVTIEKFGEPNVNEVIEYAKKYDNLDSDEVEEMLELGDLKIEYGVLVGWADGDEEVCICAGLDDALNYLEGEIFSVLENKKLMLPKIVTVVNGRVIYESSHGIDVSYKHLKGSAWNDLTEEEKDLLMSESPIIKYEGDVEDSSDYSLVNFNRYLELYVDNKSTDDNLIFLNSENFTTLSKR